MFINNWWVFYKPFGGIYEPFGGTRKGTVGAFPNTTKNNNECDPVRFWESVS